MDIRLRHRFHRTFRRHKAVGDSLVFFFVIPILSLYVQTVYAGTVKLEPGFGELKLGKHVSFVEDKYGSYSVQALLSPEFQNLWKKNTREVLSMGYTSSGYWVKGTLTNDSDRSDRYFLEIGYPMLDFIKIIVIQNGRWDEWNMGDKYPFEQRFIQYRNFVVPLSFGPGETIEIILYIKSTSAMQIPMTLWEEARLTEKIQKDSLGLSFYTGAMLVMILYNFFIYLSVKGRGYLFYVLYVMSMTVWASTMSGNAFHYLWPQGTQWNDQAILVTLNAVVLFALLFAMDFLDVRESYPRHYTVGMIFVWLCGFYMIGALFLPYRIMIMATLLTVIVVIIYGYLFIINRVFDGFRQARLFLTGWTMILLGGIVLALNKFGVVPKNMLTENAPQIGSILEVIILSFAMADRINWERKERLSAEAIAHSRARLARLARENLLKKEMEAGKAEEQAILEQEKARQYLESHVAAQTDELARSLEEVERAHEWLMGGIAYARMIQRSILPSEGHFRQAFDDYLIWWEPRDQVGGDFYWIEKNGHRWVIAVADCTGHGVPGSFMTLLASSELKRILQEDSLADPGWILGLLNRRVKNALKQNGHEAPSDEGLDIGICVVDPAAGELAFSGARHDLVYTHDGQSFRLKGDRHSVGYVASREDHVFKVHTLTLKPDMNIYLYTDGVTDQPNADEGVRFGKKNLEQLITGISGKSFGLQKDELREAYFGHKGSRDQVDDITMLGFRMNLDLNG